jgi:hypothetical protein
VSCLGILYFSRRDKISLLGHNEYVVVVVVDDGGGGDDDTTIKAKISTFLQNA